MSSSFGPPGWADPATSTAPDPAPAPAAPEPAPAAAAPEPAPPAPADPDVYVRPAKLEVPAWTPPVAAPAFVATAAARPGHAHVPADRRPFDGRRVRAYFVDAICIGLVPLFLQLTSVVTEGAALVFVAIQLIYYFLCEATTGQTVGKRMVGLRVVAQDGTPATAKQISARTVLRVIEMGPIGLIVMCLTGRRRKRLGDLLAGTVVVDASPDPGRPPKSALTILYPVGWLASSITAFSLVGHGGDVYLSEMDGLCKEAGAIVASAPPAQAAEAAFQVGEQRFAILQAVEPPPRRRALHLEILRMEGSVRQVARSGRENVAREPASAPAEQARLASIQGPVKARYAELGLKHCAR